MEKPFDFYRHYELVKKRPDEFQPSDLDDSLKPATIIIDPTDDLYAPDNQMQLALPGCTDDGKALMAENTFASDFYQLLLSRQSARPFVQEYQKQIVLF